jgi:prephenate dehydrogenase
MLARMRVKSSAKPRVALVGAGNLAGALAASLHEAGYGIDQIVFRGQASSRQRARRLGREVGG